MLKTGDIIETQRLILRRYCASDLEDLFEYLSDEETVRYEPHLPMSRQEAKEELERRIASDEMIAAVHKADNKMIGTVYLGKREFESLELGYVFNKRYWRQGYAHEGCSAMIKEAFAAGIHRIYAECDPHNEASWRLLESLGFIKEAHFLSNMYFRLDENGAPLWKDTFVYSLLKNE